LACKEAQGTPGAPQEKWSNGMKLKTWLALALSAATLGFVAVPAQAAPAGGINTLKGTAAQAANVEAVDWYGRRYYYDGPRYRYHRYHYYYGPRYHRRHWHYRSW
jgi:hypothetical protein